uniref:Fatty acyl-CoA reductase n=1 Tax=Culicoides sonorensis TaxID=179676 RepID=A0A336LMX7_CULSO
MESSIVNFYRDKTILLTGFSGFLGQIVTEKLLRSCEVKVIYVLIRNKKNKSWQNRIYEKLKDPLYDVLRKERPNFADKVVGIPGDCCLPNLGLNQDDLGNLKNNVNIVIHSAALVKFNAPLSTAININVKGTHHVIKLCKEMKQLQACIYVSTAFSNCNQTEIHEKFYKPKMSALDMLMYGVSMGAIHIFRCDRKKLAAIVPVVVISSDLVVSCMLASAWDIGRNSYQSTPIYNFVAKRSNPLTWGQFIDDNLAAARTFPNSKCYWYYAFDTTESISTAKMLHFLYHTIPGYFVDIFLILMGKKFRLSRLYKVVYSLIQELDFFTVREWKWHDNNVEALWKRMSTVDHDKFFFNMEKLDWKAYLYNSLLGQRLYVAKDDPATIPYAIKRQQVLKIVHYAVTYTIKGYIILFGIYWLYSFIFSVGMLSITSQSEDISDVS